MSDKIFKRGSEILNGNVTLLDGLSGCNTKQPFTDYAKDVSSKKQLEKPADLLLVDVEALKTILKGSN